MLGYAYLYAAILIVVVDQEIAVDLGSNIIPASLDCLG